MFMDTNSSSPKVVENAFPPAAVKLSPDMVPERISSEIPDYELSLSEQLLNTTTPATTNAFNKFFIFNFCYPTKLMILPGTIITFLGTRPCN